MLTIVEAVLNFLLKEFAKLGGAHPKRKSLESSRREDLTLASGVRAEVV